MKTPIGETRPTSPSPAPRGIDPWTTVGLVRFTVWDQWFLMLIYGQHDGAWEALRNTLRARRDGFSSSARNDADAKLCHLADLERRWASLDEVSRVRLSLECRAARTLKRAREKVIEKIPDRSQMTAPMRNPPRRILRERAQRGYWSRFPVSPVRYEPVFDAVSQSRDFFSERASFDLARRLDSTLERALEEATAPAHRTAVLRAFLTALLGAMDRADDSGGVLGELARSVFPKYFTTPWLTAGLTPELYYRDFLEFAIWEDYGLLFEQLEPFFAAVAAADVDLVDGLLAELYDELRAAELEYQAEEALTLRAELNAAQRRIDRFEALVTLMGSRHWRRITLMAEAALAAGRRDVAEGVFAAADIPGAHQEHLRTKARELLTARSAQPSRPARLTLLRRPPVGGSSH